MNIIVTGSSGFIGTWLCQLLRAEGHGVTGIDLLEPVANGVVDRHEMCDILDRPRLERIFRDVRPQAVVHLAARVDLGETRDLSGYETNMQGVANLLGVVRAVGSVRRAIYTSSQLVCRVGYVPSTDSDYCPNTLYGESKVVTERLVREDKGGGVEWCLARPTTVWGPGMSSHYQSLLRLIRKRLYFHSGDRALYKSYSFAGNIAHQYMRLLTAPVDTIMGRTFYLCDYEPLSLRAYADGLAREMGAPPIPTLPLLVAKGLAKVGDLLNRAGVSRMPFNTFRLNNILTEYVFDTKELRELCGPLPFDVPTGIRMTADWYCGRHEHPAVDREKALT